MGLFYAHLNDDERDHHRYLITFVNREAADEWWRMMSTPPSPYAGNIKRISPQVYTHNTDNSVPSFFYNAALPDAKQFHRKMTITQLFHKTGTSSIILPPVTFTDHISGRWYFVRSEAEPSSYWYLRTSGACLVCQDETCNAVHVSSEHRTKFCVQVRPGQNFQAPENFVMIGKDKISITVRNGYTVHINDGGDLKATKEYQGGTGILLGDLKDRFIARAERRVNGEVWEYVESVDRFKRGSGEAWELVC